VIKKNLWKRIILIFTCIAIVTGGVLGYLYLDQKTGIRKASHWQAYSSSDQRFDVQFPSDPKESSERMDIANKKIDYHELSSEDNGALYAVSYIDFPGHWKWLGTNKLLTKSFEMFVANESNIEEVLQKELTTHQGHSALAYRLKQDGKEIQGKFVIAGNTLYRIAVTYPLAAAEKTQPEAFLDSFQVKS